MRTAPHGDDPAEVAPAVARVITRNIHALVARERQEEREAPRGQRIADAITRFTGSLWFVFLHLVLFGSWILINLGWTPIRRFDPSFVMLAMVASVEAIFLSTFVLISQNRIQQLADQRSNLDLQISLLAEYEITRLVQLVGEIARKLGIEAGDDPELDDLAEDVPPAKVMDAIVDSPPPEG